MTLIGILLLAAAALVLRLFFKPAAMTWALYVVSAWAVFWLQASTPIRYLAFWLPVATLALAALSWALVTPPEARGGRENRAAALVLVGVIALAGLSHFARLPELLALPDPPQIGVVLLGLAAVALLGLLAGRFSRPTRGILWAAVAVLIALFVALKLPPLAALTAAGLRALSGQSTALALATDLRWLGFSYLAFRLIHTFRDRQAGRLPVISLREYVTYAVFFPAFTAGPIDRLERFIKDLRSPGPCRPAAPDLLYGGQRLLVGLFKKFVLADTLALIALSPASAGQAQAAGWLWLMLYAYSFQIFLDFSGYTDIAIGLGVLMGIRLPENFNRPYSRPNLGQFWNNWHMTLTLWFRAYFFNPLTRALRGGARPLPAPAVILITQVATMVLIGLWHGITWSFVAWGLWHGLGLFLQNRWTDYARTRPWFTGAGPRAQWGLNALSVLATFHFVALGWVWFALPDISQAGQVMARLFGF
ncbi:MAG TPA: MBOAT family O-acyltransferase [Anaerolineaceae bacterium]|nr:MBOAT family O-acyltransferase [Anaerolineaceae bacterium]